MNALVTERVRNLAGTLAELKVNFDNTHEENHRWEWNGHFQKRLESR